MSPSILIKDKPYIKMRFVFLLFVISRIKEKSFYFFKEKHFFLSLIFLFFTSLFIFKHAKVSSISWVFFRPLFGWYNVTLEIFLRYQLFVQWFLLSFYRDLQTYLYFEVPHIFLVLPSLFFMKENKYLIEQKVLFHAIFLS